MEVPRQREELGRRKRRLEITEAEFRALVDVPMALALWMHLRLSHQGLNDTFAVSAKAMAAAVVMPG